jgi:hypothetical protein
MHRFKAGKLHSGTGKKDSKGAKVKDRKQAIAIALSACGKSKYAEKLMAIGYSETTANQVTELLFAELDWEDQFETGKHQAES